MRKLLQLFYSILILLSTAYLYNLVHLFFSMTIVPAKSPNAQSVSRKHRRNNNCDDSHFIHIDAKALRLIHTFTDSFHINTELASKQVKGSYGRVDMGAIMACLIMAIIPVIVFYLSCQKYIIKGVAAGAVKG